MPSVLIRGFFCRDYNIRSLKGKEPFRRLAVVGTTTIYFLAVAGIYPPCSVADCDAHRFRRAGPALSSAAKKGSPRRFLIIFSPQIYLGVAYARFACRHCERSEATCLLAQVARSFLKNQISFNSRVIFLYFRSVIVHNVSVWSTRRQTPMD